MRAIVAASAACSSMGHLLAAGPVGGRAAVLAVRAPGRGAVVACVVALAPRGVTAAARGPLRLVVLPFERGVVLAELHSLPDGQVDDVFGDGTAPGDVQGVIDDPHPAREQGEADEALPWHARHRVA